MTSHPHPPSDATPDPEPDPAPDATPDADVALGDVHELLAGHGPLDLEELADALDADDDDLDELLEDPAFVLVAGGRLASAYTTLDGVTLTARLSGAPLAARVVGIGPALSPLEAVTCPDGHLHLHGGGIAEPRDDPLDFGDDALDLGDDEAARRPEPVGRDETLADALWFSLDDLGLPALAEGAVIGLTIAGNGGDVPTVDVHVLDEAPAVTDALVEALRASYDRLVGDEAVPVLPVQLLCQLVDDSRGLAVDTGPLPPLDELLVAAGFEVRDGYAAREGADWASFDQFRSLAKVAARRELGAGEARALATLVRAAELSAAPGPDGRMTAETASALGHLLCDSELAEAFAEVTVDLADVTRAFLRQVRQVGGRHHEAGLWWCESLVAGRQGEVEAATACLRAAIAADPSHAPALADAAWYASDRGDATEAVRLLERAEDEDDGRLHLLRHLAAASPPPVHVGRNAPCPCGSGRKYKQCCLGRPRAAGGLPLAERVGWLWEKLRWWIERVGPMDEMLELCFLLQGTRLAARSAPSEVRATELAADLDLAASLVLFVDGAIADFCAERAALLPVDEANLVAQWALGGPSVHEIARCRAGEGFGLRDLRTGDVVEVRERSASRTLSDGDLVFTHAVFDGTTHQIVGGIAGVTLHSRDRLMDLLDAGASAFDVADELARARRAPTLVNSEGEPIVRCEGTYRLADPAGAPGRLDAHFERHDAGTWAEMVEHDSQHRLRAHLAVEGDVLTLSANSEARFERAKAMLADALGSLDCIAETREDVAAMWSRLRRGAAREHDDALAGAGGGLGDPPPAEVAEALDRFIAEREVAWLDEPVPALAGLTPRQAADDPSRREDLLALLHEYERARVPAGARGYDVARLRRLLGMGDS